MLVPTIHHQRTGSGEVCRRSSTHVDSLHRPLELRKQDSVGGLVSDLTLNSVHTDQIEADLLNNDVVDLRIHKDVVDVQLANVDIGDRHRVGSGGIIQRRVPLMLQKLSSRGQINLEESLSVRNRHRDERQLDIKREPEDNGNPEVESGLSCQRSLSSTRNRRVFHISSSTSTRVSSDTRLSGLLSHISIISSLLVGLNVMLSVKRHHIGLVGIKHVSVNRNLSLFADSLTGVVAIPDQTISSTGVGSGDSTQSHVQHHIVNEVSVKRNGEDNLGSQLGSGSLHGLVLVTDGHIGLEVSVHKQLVSLLNIDQTRRRISDPGHTRAVVLDLAQSCIQKLGSHNHLILFAVIGQQFKASCRCHLYFIYLQEKIFKKIN